MNINKREGQYIIPQECWDEMFNYTGTGAWSVLREGGRERRHDMPAQQSLNAGKGVSQAVHVQCRIYTYVVYSATL